MPFFLLLHLDLLPLASGLPSRGLGAELTTLLGSPSPAPVVVSLGLRVSCARGSCAPSSEALLVLPQLFLTMNIFRERLPYPHLRGGCVCGGGDFADGLAEWKGVSLVAVCRPGCLHSAQPLLQQELQALSAVSFPHPRRHLRLCPGLPLPLPRPISGLCQVGGHLLPACLVPGEVIPREHGSYGFDRNGSESGGRNGGRNRTRSEMGTSHA